MQLPPATAHYSARVRCGRYVVRRLKRRKFTSLAKDALAANEAVLVAGRAAEDADGPVQDALADRDGADDDLDGAAKTARANLAGRSATADSEAPYTLIFPDGLGYYTAAPVDDEIERYTLLLKRMQEHLPANDVALKATAPVVKQGLSDYAAAVKALTAAKNAGAIADGHLQKAEDAWYSQLEKTYGALVVEVGRAAADQFFPKISKSRVKKGAVDPAAGGAAT